MATPRTRKASHRVLIVDAEMKRRARQAARLKKRIARDTRTLEATTLLFELAFQGAGVLIAEDEHGEKVAEVVDTSSNRFDPIMFRQAHPRMANQFTRLYPSTTVKFEDGPVE